MFSRFPLPRALQAGGPGVQVSPLVRTEGSVPEHQHDFAELSLVLAGTGEHLRDGKVQILQAGDAFLVRDAQVHALRDCQGLQRCLVIYDHRRLLGQEPGFADMAGFRAFFQLEPDLPVEAAGVCLRLRRDQLQQAHVLCQRLREEVRAAGSGAQILAHNRLRDLAVLLSRAMESTASVSQRALLRVAAAQQLMETHLSEALDLPTLAMAADCSVNQLIRDCRAVTGRTPKVLLTDLRMQRAAELLRAGHGVLDSALSVGFNDVNAFTRQFKKRHGMPPGRWSRR